MTPRGGQRVPDIIVIAEGEPSVESTPSFLEKGMEDLDESPPGCGGQRVRLPLFSKRLSR